MKDNLTWQVANLDLSKQLKELGVPQESLFYWVYRKEKWIVVAGYDTANHLGYPLEKEEHYSAFTVAELLNLIPLYVQVERHSIWVVRHNKDTFYSALTGESIADALAKLLIKIYEKDTKKN